MRVTLYTKSDCYLCDEAKAELAALQSEIPHQLVEVDIEADPALYKRYVDLVPVIKVGPYTLNPPITSKRLQITLAAARDGWEMDQAKTTSGISKDRAIKLHRAVLFLTRHWLAIVNLLVLLYVGLPFTAPVLMEFGASRPAGWIYRIYSPLCHQLPYRSWFLFGEQVTYPLELADTSLRSFEEVTGFDPTDYWGAREIIGNERMGYKVALCQRDVAIYGGILLAGVLFGLVRGSLKPLPIALWLIFGILPIALDGGSQFLSSLPLISFPARESTPLLRTLTGTIFGVLNAWLAYPYVEESMEEMRVLVAAKLEAAKAGRQTADMPVR
jgi:uncharacterized membrane protein/glutaredoxin